MIESSSFRAADGEAITTWEWPQQPSRPTLHWAHATGFCGRLYTPLLDHLAKDYNVCAWDMRGHGKSRGECPLSGWQVFYDDLVQFLHQRSEPLWLAGHSVGGMTALAAAARAPDKVLGLLLVDPVIFGPFLGLFLSLAKLLGQGERFGHAAGAKRRRPGFSSTEAAFKNYRSKKAFSGWPDEWLKLYVEHGFRRTEDGITLACTPSWESSVFTHTEHWGWPHFWSLPAALPVHVLAAGQGSTFLPASRFLRPLLAPRCRVRVIRQASHFLPMEHTELVADWMSSAISD